VLHAFSMLVCASLLVHGVSAAKRRAILRPAGYNPWDKGKPLQTGSTTMASAPDGSIYVFGGSPSSQGRADALFQLDVDTGEWHLITPMGTLQPSARGAHAMAAVGTDIYLFGGVIESGKDCIWSMGKGRRRGVCMLVGGYQAAGLRLVGMGARRSYGRKT